MLRPRCRARKCNQESNGDGRVTYAGGVFREGVIQLAKSWPTEVGSVGPCLLYLAMTSFVRGTKSRTGTRIGI
jgi:hypothetical protein